MKQLIKQHTNYSIFMVDFNYLRAVAKFVVTTNYKYHTGFSYPFNLKNEIESVCKEELVYIASSRIFIAENKQGQMIGCIRVLK